MRDSSISKMLLRLNSSDNVTIKDFTEFYQLYESISPEERLMLSLNLRVTIV